MILKPCKSVLYTHTHTHTYFNYLLSDFAQPGQGRRLLLSILVGIAALFGTFGLSAQCDPQADFTFTVNGCDVEFQPVNNGAGIMHTWSFRTTNTGFTSMSNMPVPLHTFGFASNPSRTITHTVVLGGVMYTCTKVISVSCSTGCDDKVFGYDVFGCTVAFDSDISIQGWDFGDGNTSTMIDPMHTYAASGDYTVAFVLLSGERCEKTIRVGCETTPTCCTAAFSAVATRNCSVLNLSLKAECMEAGAGTHLWTVATTQPNACITLANFSPNQPVQGMIQVTNINTCIVNSLTITHTYTCTDGTILVQTQTIALPPDGIFIGINGQTTNLTDYNCVLPGGSYNGGCIVYSSGIVQQNKIFTFSSTDIRMHPGITGFDVQTKFGLGSNTIVRGNLDPECQCLWRGIYVEGNGQLGANTVTVQDALYAVRAEENSKISLINSQFLRNFVGFRATDGPFALLAFQENIFDGVGPLMELDNCPNGLAALNDVVVSGLPGLSCTISVPYFKDEGFAGMYLDNIGSLILSPLPFNEQNIFRNLVVGIDATDTEIDVQQNSRFSNIQPGTYGAFLGGMAIRYTDKVTAGANGIRFIGNGQYAGGDPDIEDSFMGIYVNSGVFGTVTTGTRIDIGQSRIIGVHTGIVLGDQCGGPGTFIGTKFSPRLYRGVWQNHILVDPLFANDDFIGGAPKAGIIVRDFGVTQSAPEIWQNEIDVNEDSDCGSFGIRVNGLVLNQSAYQVLIDQNRVDLNVGTFGIFVSGYEGARVTNNGNNGFPGAGVYINNPIPQRVCFGVSRDVSSGIVFRTGMYNTSTCNDVRSIVGNSWLHEVSQNPNGVFARNELEGGRFSAQFRGDCNTSVFACNNMIDYSENGLRYNFGAETGGQGISGAMSRGNKWFNGNGAAIDAFIDEPFSNPAASLYFVRNIANENPTNNSLTTWIVPNVAGNNVDCFINECPAIQSPPEFYNLQITPRDSMVANREMTFNYYPEESVRLAEFHLLHKLLSCDTFEMMNNTLMHGFVDGFVGTPVYELVKETQNLVDAGKFTTEQWVSAENYQLEINQLLSEISVVDSLIKITVDTAVQAVYHASLMDLQSDLSAVQSQHQELVSNKHVEFLSEAAEVLEGVNALVPDHVFEVNTQTVLRSFIENVIFGYQPEQSTLETLHSIATQCVYTAGPSVGNARSLYERFTGDFLPETDCDGLFERDIQSQNKTKQHLGLASVYPNPANDLIFIDLADFDPGCTYHVECINVFGQTNFRRTLRNPRNQIQIGDLPNGIYQFRILKNGNDIGFKLISIQN